MLYQIYKENRETFKNCILLVQSGSWYMVLNEDANMIHYLMNYQVNYNSKYSHVSFPKTSLHSVQFILEKRNIDYMIFNGRNCTFQVHYPSNRYREFLLISKNDQIRKKEIIELIMRNLDKKKITELEIIKQKLGIK